MKGQKKRNKFARLRLKMGQRPAGSALSALCLPALGPARFGAPPRLFFSDRRLSTQLPSSGGGVQPFVAPGGLRPPIVPAPGRAFVVLAKRRARLVPFRGRLFLLKI